MTRPSSATGPSVVVDRLALTERLHRFADELRARGLPVSMVERIDAMRAVEGVALDNGHELRNGLAATLVKSADHLGVFDEVFQLFFRSAAPNSLLALSAPAEVDASLETAPTGAGEASVALEGTEATAVVDLDQALREVCGEGLKPWPAWWPSRRFSSSPRSCRDAGWPDCSTSRWRSPGCVSTRSAARSAGS